jgi:hypothetical protein
MEDALVCDKRQTVTDLYMFGANLVTHLDWKRLAVSSADSLQLREQARTCPLVVECVKQRPVPTLD